MKHLSGLDATFLYLETPETPMHVGSLHLYELPAGYQGDFYEDVKTHVARRMHLAPVFHRKLALMPFELANPLWVEDDDIDLDYHVRRIVLSKPGSQTQLEQYAARLHSSLLDRSRPLWEFYVFEGLQSGLVAFYAKVHHAALDGQGGIALANAILDVTPTPRSVKPPVDRPHAHQYQLGVAELLGAAFRNTVAQYVKLNKVLPSAVKTIGGAVLPRRDATGKRSSKLPRDWSLGPRTLFNTSITNQRTFATLSLPLAEIKQLAKQLDATLNDVVLEICSGGLRRYLEDRGGIPKKPLIGAVPISLREAGNTEMNNQVSMMLVNLASNVANPLERLRAIVASTSAAKEFSGSIKTVIPTDYPSFGAPWLMSGVASLYGRSKIANRMPPPANLVISNVPGAQFPLYLAGAKMLTYWPMSIPFHGMALNITVESYNGSLDFGLTACRRAVPDVRDLARHLGEAHAELRALAATQPAAEKPTAPAEADRTPAQATRKPTRSRRPKPAAQPAAAVSSTKSAPHTRKPAARARA